MKIIMKVNSEPNSTEHLMSTTTKFQKHNNTSTIMASSSSNVASKILPSKNHHIKRLATFILTSSCALLVVALKTADAHSIVSNSRSDLVSTTNYHRRNPDRVDTLSNPNRRTTCDGGWDPFKNKCFLFTDTRRNHEDANKYCKDHSNGTLPTIHNEEENRYLTHRLHPHSPIWLGAKHNFEYNKTYWVTPYYPHSYKQVANYTNWDKDQPSDNPGLICVNTSMDGMSIYKSSTQIDSIGRSNCVSLWDDGKWGNQIGCLVLLPVVCEKRLTPAPKYTFVDDTNGTSTSQYEQQQMFPASSANTFNHNNHHLNLVIYMLTAFTLYAKLNQQTIALVK